MRRALTWFNLYGCESVWHKPKNSLKTPKMHFCLFLSLCQTASQSQKLRQTNALCINQFYKPKDQSVKFSRKFFENGRFWKSQFFWVGHFDLIFFCFILMKIQIYMVEWMGPNFDVSLVSRKFLAMRNITLYCVLCELGHLF